ncbi:hypothetical protein [Parafrankia sp. FMc2]|uniref:hypothetical protein n=1 Tax=Parafrankia sp. FMc2 TaxID=3233196 RepID=UPI0034D6CEB2
MSTYQYYEFLAVDRPLNARQQDEVRALSTRARITATSFTNEYHLGDFGGDPRKMAAVDLRGDLRALASRSGTTVEFARRFTRLREEHLRKPSLIARFDRAGLGAVTIGQ